MRHDFFGLGAMTGALVVGLALLAVTPALALEVKLLDLELVTPDPLNAINYTTVFVEGTGTIDLNTSADASVTGNVTANLEMSFNAMTGQVPVVSRIEFTNAGRFALSDVVMNVVTGEPPAIVAIDVVSADVAGTVDTPPEGPGSLASVTDYTDGTVSFATEDHDVVLNEGTFDAAVAINGEPVYNEQFDLAEDPMTGTAEGTGTIDLELASVEGYTATYDVTLTLPLDITQSFDITDPLTETITINAETTVVATGQFTQTLPTLAGDLNSDGFVGGDDLDIVRSYWGQQVTPGTLLEGDPSGDGFVGGDDLDIVRSQWGMGTPPSPSTIPEPSACAGLLVLALAALARGRRRRA